MTCETCGVAVDQLVPCPCGLHGECPVTLGVCVSCYRTVATNALDRRRDRAGWPPSTAPDLAPNVIPLRGKGA